MVTQNTTRLANTTSRVAREAVQQEIDPVQAAEIILRRFGPRAISILTNPLTLEDGRVIPARLSANDCYVALEEACRKMARVALRKYHTVPAYQAVGYERALAAMFPDPPAYLTRCIRSVVSDAERAARREVPTISMDQPISGDGDTGLRLRDTFADHDDSAQPEEALIAQDERYRFRVALNTALRTIPKSYLEALRRDIDRDRERLNGIKVAPETDRDRQTVCRARAALSDILKRECGLDNPFVRLLAQQRRSRVRQKQSAPANWTKERQSELFRRLLSTSWKDRAGEASHPEDDVDEAVVNEVSEARNVSPPSPEMRQTMRVMDRYTVNDHPTTQMSEAQDLYDRARKSRNAGRLDDAIRLYRAAYDRDPQFYAALNEVGHLLAQTGNLRDALKAFATIIERSGHGDDTCMAATNAADIHLTWFDAGRNRERNIERATYYAKMAMAMPTPMRACNLVLAYVKDRYFFEAQQVMDTVLTANQPDCPAEKFLQTLFQIRDTDLVAWWNWLDGELGKDEIL